MPKFKVGDRVRWTKLSPTHGDYSIDRRFFGTLGEIREVKSKPTFGQRYNVWFDEDTVDGYELPWVIFEDMIEPLTGPW